MTMPTPLGFAGAQLTPTVGEVGARAQRRRQRNRLQGGCGAGVLLRGGPDGAAACQTCGDLVSAGAGTLEQPLVMALLVEPRDEREAAPGDDWGGCQVTDALSVSYQPIRGAVHCKACADERVHTHASPRRFTVAAAQPPPNSGAATTL